MNGRAARSRPSSGLLVDDPLGRTREGASEGRDFAPYETAFAAIDTDLAQLLVVATDGIEVVATMQLSFIPPRPPASMARGDLDCDPL